MIVYVFKHHTYTPIISRKSYSNFKYLTIHQAEFSVNIFNIWEQKLHHRWFVPSVGRSDDPKKLSLSIFRSKFPLRCQWLENTLQLSSGTALGTDLPGFLNKHNGVSKMMKSIC